MSSTSVILAELMICLIILLVIVGCSVGGIAVGRAIGGKASRKANFWCLFISVVCTMVSAANFVFNMGWFRVMMIWVLLPVWYVFLLFVSSKSAAACIEYKGIKAMYILYHVFFVASGLLFCDFGDEGGAYMFFGLIENVPDSLTIAGGLLFLASLGLMIAQMCVAGSLKSAKAAQTK